MKKSTIVILLVIILAGILVLSYPSFSNYLNQQDASYAITQSYRGIDPQAVTHTLLQAQRYNQCLLTGEAGPDYGQTLNLGDGLMGSLEIPGIQVHLPIYHGTDSQVLAQGIGHLEGTGLPIGGEGNHAVLTGHTGLPSAQLLTDLNQIRPGDLFYVHVLEKTLTYRVDQILTVLPQETGALLPVAGKDYCTLVTCTPYGINSHRLLVRGERVLEEGLVQAVQTQISGTPEFPPELLIAGAGALILICAIVVVLVKRK